MRLLSEIIIFCFVYTLLIKVVKGNNPLNCLFFYPVPVKDRAYELGLADEQLVIGNWFDGIVIDRFWVSQSSWVIPETADIPYLKPWKTVLVRRTLGMIVYIPIAAVFALIFSKLSICIWKG